jgi:putative ABC transport system permease protein
VSARRAGPVGIALRTALTTPGLSIFALLIVAATTFVGAAAPGLLQQAQTRSLQYALDRTEPSLRDASASTRGLPEVGGSDAATPSVVALPPEQKPYWGSAYVELDAAHEAMDPAARRVLGPPRLIVALDMSDPDPFPSQVQPSHPRGEFIIAFDPLLDDKVKWVDGSKPQTDPTGPTQVAATGAVAASTNWQLGEVRRYTLGDGIVKDLVLTGLFGALDPADPYWRHVPIALEPSPRPDGLAPDVNSAMLFGAADSLPSLGGLAELASTQVWYPFLVDRVQAAVARETLSAVRQFTATPVQLNVETANFFNDGLNFTTSSTRTIESALLRIESTGAIVALIAGGPLAVALVALALTARMLAVRRRPSIMLAAARGASIQQLGGLLLIEGLVLGLIGGAAGAAAGIAVGGGQGWAIVVVPLLIALTPAVTLPVLGLSLSRRRVRVDLGTASQTTARWRLAVELAIVALAGVAVGLVLSGARSSAGGGVDPLLTVVPLLLAAVGCVVTLRLVPLALGLIERGVPARRGLLALVGPARARRDPEIRVAPVLAVVVGVAISVFSVAFSSTVEQGIVVAARSAVGADLRVTSPYLNQDQLDDLAALDGVAHSAPVYVDEQRDGGLPDGSVPVLVYVIDVAQLRAVQTDPETALPLPGGLVSPAQTGPVPVIASAQLAARIGSDPFTIEGEPVQLLATGASFSPLGAATNWVAVDRSQADRLVATDFSPGVVLISLKPGADPEKVATAAKEVAGEYSDATTPASAAIERTSDPALTGVRVALLAAIGVVAALLALAIGMTLVLGGVARGRLLALLGALGFRRSRELPIVLWEVAPAVAVALPVGVAVGVALPFIVIPGIDLTGFVGGSMQPAVGLGGWAPAIVAAGFLGVTAVAVLVAALIARRVTAARTLRSIDEEG